MAEHRVELIGGPVPQKGKITVASDDPPHEIPVKLEEGPPIRTEEAGSLPGVQTWAVYTFHQVDDEAVAVYIYSHLRTAQ